MAKNRKNYSPEFKLKVVLEAIQGHKTAQELGSEYGINPAQISIWKDQLLESAENIYADRRQKENKTKNRQIEELQRKVGEQAMSIKWLKKIGKFSSL